MTDQDWTELGRRAVACRGWRWLPGMQIDLGGGRIDRRAAGGRGVLVRGTDRPRRVWPADDMEHRNETRLPRPRNLL